VPSGELFKEAERVMAICNACRYCEGFCAVFPAMELRKRFPIPDLRYLANLCHDCRDCYYACQYAPPHDFSVNVPKVLSEIRLATYQTSAWPAGLFSKGVLAVALVAGLSVAGVLLAVIFHGGQLFAICSGAGAFYKLIPYNDILGPASVITFFSLAALLGGAIRFWRGIAGDTKNSLALKPHIRAVREVLRLRYLDGGGQGCNYPGERFSMSRRWLHHFVFYGFLLCLAATIMGAFYEHFFHRAAPYPILSWPVVLGTAGGVALMFGTGGLLFLKKSADKAPSSPHAWSMDIAFLALLLSVAFSGLLLLVMRQTAAMGTLLVLHLGIVAGFFITLPYGKFVHALYRYLSLVRNAVEQSIVKY